MLEVEAEIERRINFLCKRIDKLDLSHIKMPCTYKPKIEDQTYFWCAVHPGNKSCQGCIDFIPQPIQLSHPQAAKLSAQLKDIITLSRTLKDRLRFLGLFLVA